SDLPPVGCPVRPKGDAPLEPYLGREDIDVIRFGTDGDVQLASFTPRGDHCEVEVDALGERGALDLPSASRHTAENALAALAAYRALGLPLAEAGAGAPDIRLSRWRRQATPLPRGGLLA